MDADETSNLVVQGPTPWQGPTRGRWNGPGIPNPKTASSNLARGSKHKATLAQLADALLSKGMGYWFESSGWHHASLAEKD
ncbi:hypothetical protein LCGC14_2456640 [marine sediment metagenome]|uniref:Uncharacterized protein n=1 Tax=marine sediment metagenome TaxID=412755 RepID=A0A0F9BF26_9ZZZZ